MTERDESASPDDTDEDDPRPVDVVQAVSDFIEKVIDDVDPDRPDPAGEQDE